MPYLLRLSDADRERFGCEEWLEFSTILTAREAAALQEPFFPGKDGELDGFNTPNEFREALRGTPMFDQYGAPVMVDNGEGGQEQKRRPHFGAELVLAWVALKRAGAKVPDLKDFDYDLDLAQYVNTDAIQEGPGKDDGSDQETTSSE